MDDIIVKMIQDVGVLTGLGVAIFLLFKHLLTKFLSQAMETNNALIENLLTTNQELLKTNERISNESRKAIEENTKVLQTLINEIRSSK